MLPFVFSLALPLLAGVNPPTRVCVSLLHLRARREQLTLEARLNRSIQTS